jgi:Fic family protein
VFLVERGLLKQPILYLSRAIIATKPDYYRLLLRVKTHGEWERWTKYMVEIVGETARWTTAKVRAIRVLMDATVDQVKARAPRLYSRELVELVFTQPYCRIGNVVEAGIAKRQAASEYLKKLAAIDVLQERKVGREKLFVNPRLMTLLTAETHEVPVFGEARGR